MALRKGRPIRFVAQGLSDALDGTDVFPGACSVLKNLIPDYTTKGLWVARPAATRLTNFASFTTPGFISCAYIVGTRVYGLIASGRNAGNDEPFCYDIAAATFVTITGITAANTPTSPVTTGTWEPPTMALVGTKLVVTHPGFNVAGGYYFGWFETSNPAAVTWNAGNTTVNLLPARPSAVAQFGDRAWFLVNPTTGQPTAYFTDILLLSITNAAQAVTFGDNKRLVAAIGLPLNNQLGGVIQSLIVFKDENMYQVTGDYALNTLTRNALNVATTTAAPRSLVVSPKGIGFIAADGLRVIGFDAHVSDPIGAEGSGVNSPFVNALYPSRIAAGCNANTYRVTVQDSSKAGTPTYEYWYDIVKNKWSGPHTFPADICLPYGNTFVVVPKGVTGSLWQSDAMATTASTYVENGTTIQCQYRTALLPDDGGMSENSIVETAIELVVPLTPNNIVVAPLDEDYNNIIPSVTVNASGTPSLFGSAIWGTSLWGGASTNLKSVRIPWTAPIVFKRLTFDLQFNANATVKIGAISARYQKLGYLQQ